MSDTTETTTTTTSTGIEAFVLPRSDWYDSDGRLYKDAIIENLNAIESKLNELNSLNAFDAEIPDVSTLHLSDVTLTSDESKVVNLESFLDIFGLVNYPAEVEFSGTTIKKLSYWNSSYNYVTRNNITTNASESTPYVIFDFSSTTVTTESTMTTVATGTTLLGCYIDGRIVNLHTPLSAKLNLMYLLGNMNTTSQVQDIRSGTDNYYFSSGQQAAIGHVESRGWSRAGNMTFYEEGR